MAIVPKLVNVMPDILKMANPLKIFSAVVRYDAVNVVNLHLSCGSWAERLCNILMNVASSSNAAIVKPYRIATMPLAQRRLNKMHKSLSHGRVTNPPKIRDFVRESWDCRPFFSRDIGNRQEMWVSWHLSKSAQAN
jgi:hypothetical protein